MSATLTRQLRASTPLMRAGPPIASASRIPLPPRLSHISLSRSIPISQSFHTSSARLTSPPRPAYRSLHISAPTERAPPVAHVGLANGNASTAGNSTGSQGAGNGTHGSGSGSGSAAGAGQGQKKKSGHMVWYREIVPAMIPILLLSTTLFLLLSLLRTHLSHERQLSDASVHISALEKELFSLRREARAAKRRAERERRERERILPLVVERVLQRVGAKAGDEEGYEADGEDGDEALLV